MTSLILFLLLHHISIYKNTGSLNLVHYYFLLHTYSRYIEGVFSCAQLVLGERSCNRASVTLVLPCNPEFSLSRKGWSTELFYVLMGTLGACHFSWDGFLKRGNHEEKKIPLSGFLRRPARFCFDPTYYFPGKGWHWLHCGFISRTGRAHCSSPPPLKWASRSASRSSKNKNWAG